MWILSVTILIMIRKYCTSYDCVKTAYCPMYFNSSTQCSQSQTVTIPQSSGTRLHICHQVSLRKLMGMTHLLGSTTKINSSNWLSTCHVCKLLIIKLLHLIKHMACHNIAININSKQPSGIQQIKHILRHKILKARWSLILFYTV